MKKNVILVQLQGINQTRLWMYREELGAVWRFLQTSVRHSRFLTTSTTSEATWRETEPLGHTLSESGYAIADCREEFTAGLARMKDCSRPFYARYHIGAGSEQDDDGSDDIAERLRQLFARINDAFSSLMTSCARLNIFENTVFAVFGDGAQTGRDFPSAARTQAPFFLFNSENASPATTDRLACTLDIAPTVLGLLFPRQSPARTETCAGVDLSRGNRRFVLSRNDNGDKAVSDGTYRLTVGRDNVMSLYCDQTDPENSRDLLLFYTPDTTRDEIFFSPPPGAVAKHFLHTFSPPQTTGIAAIYAELHAAMNSLSAEKRNV